MGSRRYPYVKSEQHEVADGTAPQSSGRLDLLVSYLANRVKAITGKASWLDAPDTTLADSASHHSRADNPHGVTASQTGAISQGALDSHAADTQNPHSVSAEQAGAKPSSYVPAWTEVTDKPSSFAPSAHKASHATGGADVIAPADIGAAPTSRSIATTAPLTGGGTLAANRTLGITDATPTSRGAMAATDKAKLNTLLTGDSYALADDPRLQVVHVGASADEIQSTMDSLAVGKGTGQGTGQGGVVFIPPGTYIVDGLTIPANVTLAGAGLGVSVLRSSVDSPERMVSMPNNNARLEGLTIDHTPALHPTIHYDAQTTPDYAGEYAVSVTGDRIAITRCEIIGAALDAIDIESSEDVWVTDNYIDTADRGGIVVAGPAEAPTRHAMIHNNRVQNTYASALMANGAIQYATFSANVCSATGGSGDGLAAYSPNADLVTISDNVIWATGNNGIHAGGTNFTITGNVIRGPAMYGIFYGTKTTTVPPPISARASISNNVIVSPGLNGVYLRYTEDCSVSANSIYNCSDHAVDVANSERAVVASNTIEVTTNAAHGVSIAGSADVSVSGNQVHGCAGDGIRGYSRAETSTKRVAVSGNVISGCEYGIASYDSSNSFCVTGNLSINNRQGSIALVGSNNQEMGNL